MTDQTERLEKAAQQRILAAIDARQIADFTSLPDAERRLSAAVRTEEGPRWSAGNVVSTHRSISAAPSFSSCVSSTADCRPSSVPA